MHGAGLDVLWLQRDFGIYVCNLFDTGQAARVLELESFGLSYLLKCFCDVTPDKRYQMADWRLRPLTVEMIKYAREDTHYLLYIRDLLQEKLVASQAEDKQELLVEVLRRSRDICLRLYEKEITTETSFLQVYGLDDRKFNTQQLSVLSALYSWRDQTARVEDESTGYVLPNHLLLKLAEEMPDDVKALRTILNGRHKVVARNSATIVNIISKAKLLPQTPEAKSQSKLESAKQKSSLVFEEVPFAEDATSQACENNQDSAAKPAQESFNFDGVLNSSIGECSSNLPVTGVENGGKDVHITTNIVFQKTTKSALFGNQKGRTKNKEKIEHLTKSIVVKRAIGSSFLLKSKKNNKVGKMLQNIAMEVEIPPYGTTRNGNQQAVNAEGKELEDLVYMLDNRASLQVEATTNPFFKEDIMQAEAKARAEKIRASFSLPFHSFEGGQMITEEQSAVALEQDYNERVPQGLESQEIEDISPLKDDLVTSSVERGTDEQGHMISKGICISPDGVQCRLWWPDRLGTAAVLSSVKSDNDPQDVADSNSSQTEYPVPLSQKFSQQKERSKMNTQLSLPNTYNASGIKQEGQSPTESVTPFDYAAAKKNMDFFRSPFETKQGEGSNLAGWNERRESSQRIFNPRTQMKEFKPEGITPGKRRQVFPQSGNRTGVFK
ncbi:hypothetical protein KP509_03G064000 [Ceratopteris richardii]|uniref:HRDC domain-containing protein n=1 Tax=Ceratopteris richardii TaxID=49495 RepID=A0A8T2V832_CERRI|nr:hypothetical protein KP509_03G064000 [Ceratopteris richardii]